MVSTLAVVNTCGFTNRRKQALETVCENELLFMKWLGNSGLSLSSSIHECDSYYYCKSIGGAVLGK